MELKHERSRRQSVTSRGRQRRLDAQAEGDDGGSLRSARPLAGETGRKVASTFVPGNLNELIMCFDMLNNLPEINAIQNGMRKKSGS